MENIYAPQSNIEDLAVNHFETGLGSLDEYKDKKTGNLVRIVMKNGERETEIFDIDPTTGKLNERRKYNKAGELIKFQDQKATRKALQEGNLWQARLLEEIRIQGGNVDSAMAVIDQGFDEEMLIQEQEQ